MLGFISAIGFGVTAGAIIGAIVTGDPVYTITWSITLTVSILAGVFSSVGSFQRGIAQASTAQLAGEPALARVERVTRTGLSINDQPQLELALTVAPTHRPAYTTVHRQIVDIVFLPQVQPGSIIVVRRPDPDKANVVVQFEPPLDWAKLRDAERLRSGSERTVPLASEATAWAAQPQTMSWAPKRPGRPGRTLLLAGAFLVSAALVLIPAYGSIGRTVQAFASGDPDAAGVVLGDRHQEIVDALEAETGGSEFIRIGFYDGYALAEAPSAPGALTIDDYEYRYDRTSHDGPTLIQPDDPAAALFDADEIDFSRIPEYIATAREASGITEPDSVYVFVSRALIEDEAGARPVEITISLDSPYEDASVTFDAATGERIRE